MSKHLKIFKIVPSGKDMVICPIGEGASFRYADLQMEANYVRTLVTAPDVENIVFDLGQLNYFGSEFIGAIITIAREKKNRGGKVAICNVIEQMHDVLRGMSLYKLWPYFETPELALASFIEEDASDPEISFQVT